MTGTKSLGGAASPPLWFVFTQTSEVSFLHLGVSFAKINDASDARYLRSAIPLAKWCASPTRSPPMHIRCPHCHNTIEVVEDAELQDLVCSSCGSSFNLLPDETISRQSAEHRRLGRFELVERIGIGAFGEVWSAHDSELDRTVAVKIPRKGQLTTEEAEAFLREARSAAQLHHPNIVAVHEVGKENDQLFIVSDFVKGITLADWLTGKRPTPKEAAKLTAKIADAVQHAHEHGVIHRDLKPSNIMLDEDGQPHIMDFGLAKRNAGEITMTMEGRVLGTPAYMSPEQAKGAAHDANEQSDVYSLGVILFELLTGELPFRGNARMLLHQVINDEPPSPRRLNNRIPSDLNTVCLKCLEKAPDRRYQSARQFGDDLGRLLAGQAIQARPVSRPEHVWRWCQRNPLIATLVVTAVALLIAGVAASTHFAIKERIQSKEVARIAQGLTLEKAWNLPEQGHVPEGMLWMVHCLETIPGDQTTLHTAVRANLAAWHQQLHTLQAVVQLASPKEPVEYDADSGPHAIFTRNGLFVVTASPDGAIQFRNATTLQPIGKTLRHSGGIDVLVASPNGRLFLTGGRDKAVRLWDVETHQQIGATLEHDARVTAACFSFDGTRIVTGSADGKAYLWDVDSRMLIGVPFEHLSRVSTVSFNCDGSNVITTDSRGFHAWDIHTGKQIGDVTPSNVHVFSLQFSPQQPCFVFGSQDQTVQVWDAVAHEPVRAGFAHPEPVHAVAFGRNGREIVTGCRDGKVRRWDLRSGKLIGSPMRHALSVCSVAFSPDQSRIVTASIDRTVCIWKTPKSNHRGPLQHDGMVRGVQFSPDGEHALTASSDGKVQEWDISTLEPYGNPICVAPRTAYTAAYSPDGAQIAVGYSGGVRQWDRRSATWARATLAPSRQIVDVTYSPDGELLLTAGGGMASVWRVVDGTCVFSKKGFSAARFNHDGSRILASSFFVVEPSVCVWDSNSGKALLRLPIGRTIPWAVAFLPGEEQCITGTIDGVLSIWDTNIGRLVRRCLQRHQSSIRRVVATPDGKQIVTASHDRTARIWDVTTGRTIGPPLSHLGPVKAVAVSPDGKHILTGDGNGEAWIWDVPPPPLGPEIDVPIVKLWVQVVTGMELLPDGEVRLLTASEWNNLASQLRNNGDFQIIE